MSPTVRKHEGIVIGEQPVLFVVAVQALSVDSLVYSNFPEPRFDAAGWTTTEAQGYFGCNSVLDLVVAKVQVLAVLDRQLSSSAELPELARTSTVYFLVSCPASDRMVYPPQRQHHFPHFPFSIVPLSRVLEWFPLAPPSSWLLELFCLA